MISGMETGKSAGGDGMSWVVHEDMRIEMTKGDTPSFAFQAFLPDGSEYEFEEGDSVVFAAKRNKAASGTGKIYLGAVLKQEQRLPVYIYCK